MLTYLQRYHQHILIYDHNSKQYVLNSKDSVGTNLKSFNSDNKSISSFLIDDSISLSCSSGLKEFKI